MKTTDFVCIGLLLTGVSVSIKAANPPNIILINIDDLGWTDISSNGSTYYETPNIDRLKSMGVWFPWAYAGAANSAPSRACMLTGQNTPRHGMYTVEPADRGPKELRKLLSAPNRKSLPDGIQMLPDVLRQAGYQTYHVGKWHVTEDPTQCGVDINVGGFHAGHPRSYFSPYSNPNLKDGENGEFLTERLGNEAVKLILNSNKSKPYFLYYAPYAVHSPLQAPKELIDKYKKKPVTKAHNNPVYAALVEVMDKNVGKILDAVEKSGRASNTLIVFTTDNGGVYETSKQWPLRAGKGSFYEGGIRVPMIVYQSGKYEGREVSDIAVCQMDLFPTFLDIAGISKKDMLLDGKSLLPILKNHSVKDFKERPLYWHFPAYLENGNKETVDMNFRSKPVSVIKKGEWKLIENYEDESKELYNLNEDLGERNNLADSNIEKVKELSFLLNTWKEKVNAPCKFKLNPYYKQK